MHTTTGTGRLPMDHHYPIHGHAARSTWTGNNDYRRHVDGHDAGSRYTTSHRPSEQELDAAVANVLLGDRRNHHARRNTAYVGEYDVHRAGDLHAATRVSEDTDPIRQRLLGPTLTRARASTFTSAPATQPLVARFNPLPTHATSSAAGVRLRIHVDEAVHVAGGLVTGWLEVNRLQAGSAVRLGEAWVRLTGEEELEQEHSTWNPLTALLSRRRKPFPDDNSHHHRLLDLHQQLYTPAREVDDDAAGYRTVPVHGGRYPFCFRLPEELPSSFESRGFRVRYRVMGLTRVRVNGILHVLMHTHNLVLYQRQADPTLYESPSNAKTTDTKQLQLHWPIGSGSLLAHCSLAYAHFVAGDEIRVRLDVINKTNCAIGRASVRLVRQTLRMVRGDEMLRQQRNQWKGMALSRQRVRVLARKIVGEMVLKRGVLDEQTSSGESVAVVQLEIPNICHSILNTSSALVSYRVEVELSIGISTLTLAIPVMITHPSSFDEGLLSRMAERVKALEKVREPTLPMVDDLVEAVEKGVEEEVVDAIPELLQVASPEPVPPVMMIRNRPPLQVFATEKIRPSPQVQVSTPQRKPLHISLPPVERNATKLFEELKKSPRRERNLSQTPSSLSQNPPSFSRRKRSSPPVIRNENKHVDHEELLACAMAKHLCEQLVHSVDGDSPGPSATLIDSRHSYASSSTSSSSTASSIDSNTSQSTTEDSCEEDDVEAHLRNLRLASTLPARTSSLAGAILPAATATATAIRRKPPKPVAPEVSPRKLRAFLQESVVVQGKNGQPGGDSLYDQIMMECNSGGRGRGDNAFRRS